MNRRRITEDELERRLEDAGTRWQAESMPGNADTLELYREGLHGALGEFSEDRPVTATQRIAALLHLDEARLGSVGYMHADGLRTHLALAAATSQPIEWRKSVESDDRRVLGTLFVGADQRVYISFTTADPELRDTDVTYRLLRAADQAQIDHGTLNMSQQAGTAWVGRHCLGRQQDVGLEYDCDVWFAYG